MFPACQDLPLTSSYPRVFRHTSLKHSSVTTVSDETAGFLFPSLVIQFGLFFPHSRKCFFKSSYHSCPLCPQSLDICSSFSAFSQVTVNCFCFPHFMISLAILCCFRTSRIYISCSPHFLRSCVVFICLKTVCIAFISISCYGSLGLKKTACFLQLFIIQPHDHFIFEFYQASLECMILTITSFFLA